MNSIRTYEFKGELIHPHQPAGMEWMYQKELCKPAGGVLCDEMGMGKTIQCLALMCKRPQSTLVVVPKSLITQWQNSIQTYTNLPCDVFSKHSHNENSLVTICTYNNVQCLSNTLHKTNWGRIILDEGHVIRNKKTKLFHAVCNLSCNGARFVLTGTPVFNVVDDVVNLLLFIGFGSIECRDNLDRIKNNYFLRRIKTQDTNSASPQLSCVITDVKVQASDDEQKIYRSVFHKQRKIIAKSDENCRSLSVLNGILKCRQAMIHPNLVQNDTQMTSTKMEMVQLKISSHLEDKCIIFCHFKKEMQFMKEHIKSLYSEDLIAFIHGDLTTLERDEQLHNFENQGNVLIIQMKVGGVGLNLQHANHIYLTSPSWNPATDLQAIHRSYRTGQQKQVNVTRLFMENIDELPSIDMAILHLQDKKQQLTNQVLEEDKNTNLLGSIIDGALPDSSSIKYFAKVFQSTTNKWLNDRL